MADMVGCGRGNGDKTYIFQRGALMAFCALAALAIGIASARFSALCGQGLGSGAEKGRIPEASGIFFSEIWIISGFLL